MFVRPAGTDEAHELARVHHESAVNAYAHVAPPRPDGLARREVAWREVLASPVYHPFVAEEGGEIVGVLNVGPARSEPNTGEIYVLYVHPDWWGTEAGQQLIECAHATLTRCYSEAILTVLADNPRARRFYERNGWVLDELLEEPHFGGRLTEVARYRKVLDEGKHGC